MSSPSYGVQDDRDMRAQREVKRLSFSIRAPVVSERRSTRLKFDSPSPDPVRLRERVCDYDDRRNYKTSERYVRTSRSRSVSRSPRYYSYKRCKWDNSRDYYEMRRFEYRKRPSKPESAALRTPGTIRVYDSLSYFTNLKKIGEGTFGKVYKARFLNSNVQVALKKVEEKNKSSGDVFSVPNIRELSFLTKFQHPNILKFHGVVSITKLDKFNELKPQKYLVLEYMDYDLTSLFLHGGSKRYRIEHIKCIAKQLFSGLAFIHSQNFIHRDIKGGNILLNRKGQLKIADFGFACSLPADADFILTNRVCTIFYRPMELLLGGINYGPEVDMWSAGCIFAELFLRVPVFKTQSGSEVDQLIRIRQVCGPVSQEDWNVYANMSNSWVGFFGFLMDNTEPRLLERILSKCKEITEYAIDIAEKLLVYNPKRRLSANQCLNHRFFTEEYPPACSTSEMPPLEGEWHELEWREKRRLDNALEL